MAQTEDLDSIRFLEAGMAAGSHGVWGHGRVPTPGEAELARLRERFRGHHIFHDVRWAREVRYLAYRTASGVQPDTVITDDLAELREQLEQAAPPDLGTGLFLLFAQEPGIGDPDACQWSSGPNPAVPAVDTGLAGSTRRWSSTGTAQRRAACGTLSSPAGLHRAELCGIAIKAALERAAESVHRQPGRCDHRPGPAGRNARNIHIGNYGIFGRFCYRLIPVFWLTSHMYSVILMLKGWFAAGKGMA